MERHNTRGSTLDASGSSRSELLSAAWGSWGAKAGWGGLELEVARSDLPGVSNSVEARELALDTDGVRSW